MIGHGYGPGGSAAAGFDFRWLRMRKRRDRRRRIEYGKTLVNPSVKAVRAIDSIFDLQKYGLVEEPFL